MHQHWRDATFVHWAVDPQRLERLMPPGARPDVHDGRGWVGLIPFRMVGGGLGRARPVPRYGTFLETNVRTYSRDERGRRGVVFLSLDADRLPVVLAARAVFGVPYQWSQLHVDPLPVPVNPAGTTVTYTAHRHSRHRGSGPQSRLTVRVGPAVTEPTSLEVFLTARFGLHTRHVGRTLWVPNTHAPWPLHRAELLELDDQLVAAAGLADVTARPPDSVLFSPGVETVFGVPSVHRHR